MSHPVDTLKLALIHRLVMRRQRRALMLLLWLLPKRLREARDVRGWSALHWAVALGEGSLVTLLLNHGAEVNAQSVDGRTPLHHAVQFGQEGLMALLMASGADDRPDHAGVTPAQLHRRLLSPTVVGQP